MASTDLFHADFRTRPYWWDDAAPDPARTPPPARTDVAIVGSGYCGLAAALDLARGGARVAVLDAGRIGEGASTRNGGMVSGGLKLPEKMRAILGETVFSRIVGEAVASFHHLERFIETEGFDAGYERVGRFTGAHSPGAFRRLTAQTARMTEQTGFKAHMVTPERQHEEIGSILYHGGQVVEEAGGLHPARYHRALRQACAAEGVTLHGDARVTTIDRGSNGFSLTTTAGPVRAERVIVATNGYSGPLMPWLQRRIVPIASYMIATEALPTDLIAELSPKARMLVDTKRVLYYFRLSPDGRRILFGGRASFRNIDERTAACALHRFMCSVWPKLETSRLTHAWKGNVGFSLDMLPHMGCRNGVHFAGGCQGTGVAMATWLGHRTARGILNDDSTPSVFAELPFADHPLYRGRPWFLPLLGNYYRLRDKIEIRSGW